MRSQRIGQATRLFPWKAHSPGATLQHFLTHDTAENVFRKEYDLSGNRLCLDLRYPGGRLSNLRGFKKPALFADFRKEQVSGRPVAYLYGWYDRSAWGDYSRCDVKYLYSRKARTKWHLLDHPKGVIAVSKNQAAYSQGLALGRALAEGLGRTALRREWPVQQDSGKIVFGFNGRSYSIGGFSGSKTVFSVLTEEKGRIIARFYASEAAADKNEGLLKAVVMNRQTKRGSWPDQLKLQLLYATAAARAQHSKLVNRQLLRFLTGQQLPGTVFETGTRKVNKHGAMLRIGGTPVYFPGLGRIKHATGRIVNKGTEKRIYFWPSEKEKQKGEPPIIPQGHLIAQKKEGRWEVVWEDRSHGRTKGMLETTRLGNFIFANVGGRTLTASWPVLTHTQKDGTPYQTATRMIRRSILRLTVTSIDKVDGQIFSEVREFGGRLKLIEFWPNESAFKFLHAPFTARFAAFKRQGPTSPEGRGWIPFFYPVNASARTIAAFRELIAAGQITYGELRQILGDRHFRNRCYPMPELLARL